VFDNYLDFVHESYFVNDAEIKNNENIAEANSNEDNNFDAVNKKTNLFKFSSLDLLINPLRKKYVFEMWNPYEIALFECCVCKFNKNFDLYPKIVIINIKIYIVILKKLDKKQKQRRYNEFLFFLETIKIL
jgi:hypothetical protein